MVIIVTQLLLNFYDAIIIGIANSGGLTLQSSLMSYDASVSLFEVVLYLMMQVTHSSK